MTSARRSLILRSLLAGAVLLAGTGIFHRARIAPLQKHTADAEHESAVLRDHLEATQKELTAIKDLEQQNWRFRQALDSLHKDSPVAPAVAWVPNRMKSRLADLGVTQADIRLNTMEPEPRIAGFSRSYWHIALPPQNGTRRMTDALLAAAQLEQHDRFVKIIDLSIHADPDGSAGAGGHINVAAFVRR